METKLRIAFIKDWHDDLEHIGGNQDGILAAIAELSKRHHVTFFTQKLYPNVNQVDINGIDYWFVHDPLTNIVCQEPMFDILISWGSLDRPWHQNLKRFKLPAILCFAGGPTKHEYLSLFDHVCVESKVYEDEFKSQGVSVSRAFGTNSQVFRPEPRSPKVFRAIYPASYCFHKNIELFARAVGSGGLAVGNWNEMDIVGVAMKFGTAVMRKVSSNALCDLYNMAHVTVVPCGTNGGSQRTVLESMACGIPVVLADDNDKCREFVEESGFGVLVPPVDQCLRDGIAKLTEMKLSPQQGREYILSKWTHEHYADGLEYAIKKVLNK